MSGEWINRVHFGDCLETLRRMPDGIVNTCVTSPPYFGLRDYGHAGQIGLEEAPEQFIAKLVEVFREVRRVLRDDGTAWVNIGDSYNNFRSQMGPGQMVHGREKLNGKPAAKAKKRGVEGLKEKDLMGIPWMLAFALRDEGWYLRQDIIWSKPNPMPESVRDRCTKAHEYVFLLSKSERYYLDGDAIREQAEDMTTRNRRSVWTVPVIPYRGAHFATFPPELIEPCIMAGAPAGGIVLDPFIGSGTTAEVATRLGRKWIGCELNSDYEALQAARLHGITPGLELSSRFLQTLA